MPPHQFHVRHLLSRIVAVRQSGHDNPVIKEDIRDESTGLKVVADRKGSLQLMWLGTTTRLRQKDGDSAYLAGPRTTERLIYASDSTFMGLSTW